MHVRGHILDMKLEIFQYLLINSRMIQRNTDLQWNRRVSTYHRRPERRLPAFAADVFSMSSSGELTSAWSARGVLLACFVMGNSYAQVLHAHLL